MVRLHGRPIPGDAQPSPRGRARSEDTAIPLHLREIGARVQPQLTALSAQSEDRVKADVTYLRTPIHQPGRPIRPLAGPVLELYVDLMIRREDLETCENLCRKEALLAN